MINTLVNSGFMLEITYTYDFRLRIVCKMQKLLLAAFAV